MNTEEKAASGFTMEGVDTMPEDNKNMIRGAVEEIWNHGNYEKIDQYVWRDLVVHLPSQGDDIRGAEGVIQFYSQLRQAFPDIHFEIEDQIAEGNKVVTYWTAQGTHKGTFKNIPPSGRKFNVQAIDIHHIVNGKVVECWAIMNELSLLQQLGAVPSET